MVDYSEKKVALVGSGLIGAGWAIHLLRNGAKHIKMYDLQEASLVRAKERIEEGLKWFEENGILTAQMREEMMSIPTFTTDMAEAVGDADFILENGPENLEIKQSILANIEAVCPEKAIITSSTSGIMIRRIAANAIHPERVIGAHPYLPVYLLPLVEIVISEQVAEENVQAVVDFMKSTGKKPVVLRKDSPGYIGTRMMNVVRREATKMLMDGVCSVEDLDTAFTFGPGLRWALMGPFMVLQLTGGDHGIRGLFCGSMNGNPVPIEKPIGDEPVLEAILPPPENGVEPIGEEIFLRSLCRWVKYPVQATYYMQTQLSDEVEQMMADRNWTNTELAEFRDKGLLELLKYHGLVKTVD